MNDHRLYFVAQEEITAKHKSAMSAALLAIFLGPLGIHRFYLKRNRSGVAIILVNVLSLGLGLLLTVPLVLCEGIYYAYIESKARPRRVAAAVAEPPPAVNDQPSETNQKFAQGRRANNAAARKNISDFLVPPKAEPRPRSRDLNIIEIGGSTPQPIPAPIARVHPEPWLNLLEIPYERRSMNVSQIKHETLKLFEILCNVVDQELHKNSDSLLALKHNLEQSGQHYGNILYTIYCISEGEVERHYSSAGYSNTFSYELLEKHTDPHFVEIVRNYCENYVDQLPAADDTTRSVYHLTPNGLPPVWWDQDGFIRGSYKLSSSQTRILNRTPYRSTIVLNISEIRLLVIAQYLATMSTLKQHFESSQDWPSKTAEYLNHLFGKESNYDPYDYSSAWIAHYILKLCEQTIRQNIPYSRLLNTDSEIAYIKGVVPSSAYEAILERATHPIKSFSVSEEAIEALRKQSPQAWKRNIAEIASAEPERYARVLEQYRNDPDFASIAKQAVKQTSGHVVNRLVACYAYFATVEQEDIEKPILRDLNEIITHPVQQRVFMETAERKLPFNSELVSQLKVLTLAPVHSVKLDASKIKAARTAHEEALKQVANYLGEDEVSDPVAAKVEPKNDISIDNFFGSDIDDASTDTPTLDNDQSELLRLVVDADYSLDMGKAESFARAKHKLLGSLLQGINKQYYELLEDQLLRTVDGKITVEEIYREQVKETTT